MRRDDLFIAVPALFRCPISLEIMESPVSLCTGVTYDRTSIQRWLDGGNNTCPATMQLLPTKDFVPNHTLQRLIQIWSDSAVKSTGSISSSLLMTTAEASDIAGKLMCSRMKYCRGHISKLLSFAQDSDQNRKSLASIDGFSQFLLGIVADRANLHTDNLIFLEESVMLLQLVLREDIGVNSREHLAKYLMQKREKVTVSTMIFVLQRGNLSSRIATAKALELVALDAESKLYFADKSDLLSEIFRLATCESDPEAIESGLSCLICLSMPRRAKMSLIRLGAVQSLGKMLNKTNLRIGIAEKVLKLLEIASTTKEGSAEICGRNGECITALVKKILKVSTKATEHVVTILWSLCCVFRDAAAQEAVASSNGGTKILLLMQSNCSPAVRQMAGELLKIFGVKLKSKGGSGSCLLSYETKTTHIMPF